MERNRENECNDRERSSLMKKEKKRILRACERRYGGDKSIGDFVRNRGGYSSSTHYSRYGAEAEVYGVDGYSL